MVPTAKKIFWKGELRTGWASWDKGQFEQRSVKYAYPDASGKISRGCPELSPELLVEMTIFANEQGELSESDKNRLIGELSKT